VLYASEMDYADGDKVQTWEFATDMPQRPVHGLKQCSSLGWNEGMLEVARRVASLRMEEKRHRS